MSKEFIEKGYNGDLVARAKKQESQLSYFLEGKLEEDTLTSQYISQWAERQYQGSDYFLNFVKSIFKDDVFLNFFKYLRNPVASAKLIKNVIEPQLRNVFIAEDSNFKYDVSGVDAPKLQNDLNTEWFEEEAFYRLLYKHNSIVISDKSKKAYRYFIDIDRVKSILEDSTGITEIAFHATIGEDPIILYINDKIYEVWTPDLEFISKHTHNLGHCPAHFLSKRGFQNQIIVKESLYSYIREELEEFVFLKTLQLMTSANGAIPVVTKLKVNYDNDKKSKIPKDSNIMSSKVASKHDGNPPQQSGDLQPGTVHEINPIKKNDGSFDSDTIEKLINFHYTPTEALEFLKTRVEDVEKSIINKIIGDVGSEANEGSKNETHIEKALTTLQNTLKIVSTNLSRIRQLTDYDIIALNYGKGKINDVFIFYGFDNYLDSQTKLFNDLDKAKNQIERKNILLRINQNKYKGNKPQKARAEILYELIPFVTDVDFDHAKEYIDDSIFDYYVRFPYWVTAFENIYGDIVSFYEAIDMNKGDKLILINNIIINLIKNDSTRIDRASILADRQRTGVNGADSTEG